MLPQYYTIYKMKKHITIIALALISLATVFSGCKKDNNNDQPEQKQKYTVRYELNNVQEFTNPLTGEVTTFTISPCFKANFSYTDADGQMKEVTDVALPWSTEIVVEKPFTAKMEGSIDYEVSELPDEVTYGTLYGILYKPVEAQVFSGEILGQAGTTDKERFILYMGTHPDRLKFSQEFSIE